MALGTVQVLKYHIFFICILLFRFISIFEKQKIIINTWNNIQSYTKEIVGRPMCSFRFVGMTVVVQ